MPVVLGEGRGGGGGGGGGGREGGRKEYLHASVGTIPRCLLPRNMCLCIPASGLSKLVIM